MASNADCALTKLLFPVNYNITPSDDGDNYSIENFYTSLASDFVLECVGHKCVDSQRFVKFKLLSAFSEELQLSADCSSHISLMVDSQLLTENSKYFKVLFEIGMRESLEKIVQLQDVKLVDFLHMYYHVIGCPKNLCDLCRLNDCALLFQLIDTSIYLQSNSLSREFLDLLLDQITTKNCLDAMVCAFKYSEQRLFSKALRFCLFYTNVMQNNKLEKHLNSVNSQIVLYCLQHPMLNRKVSSDKFGNISRNMKTSKFISSECQQSIPFKELALRTILNNNQCIQVQLTDGEICGDEEDGEGKVLYEAPLTGLDSPRGDRFIGYAVCSEGEKIYITGGEIGLGRGKWNDNIYQLDTVKRSLDIIGKIPERRRHHRSCCTADFIYLAGGHDKYRCKRDEVFRLSIHSGCESKKLPPLPGVINDIKATDSVLGAVCGSHVYILDLLDTSLGWKLGTDEEISSLELTKDKDDTSMDLILCPWHPSFQLPKF